MWDPHYDDTEHYIYDHASHIHRITSTASWYIAKVSLIYVLSEKLYISFIGSVYAVNKTLIIVINIFNTIVAPIELILAFWYVYNGNLLAAEISFNSWRIVYQLIVLIILCMFTKRLLLLTSQSQIFDIQTDKNQNEIEIAVNDKNEKSNVSNSQHNTPVVTPDHTRDIVINSNSNLFDSVITEQNATCTNIETSNDTINKTKKESNVSSPRKVINVPQNSSFLALAVRNSILILTISVTVFLVTFCFFGFRFIFGSQTRITLLIPMNMASFDSVITSICIICLFHCGEELYYKICGKYDILCRRICAKIGTKFC